MYDRSRFEITYHVLRLVLFYYYFVYDLSTVWLNVFDICFLRLVFVLYFDFILLYMFICLNSRIYYMYFNIP